MKRLQTKDLEIECDSALRHKVARQMLVDCQMVGRSLKVSEIRLTTIDIESRKGTLTPEDAAVKVLDAWYEEFASRATCLKLAQALNNHNKTKAIEILCEEVKKNNKVDLHHL